MDPATQARLWGYEQAFERPVTLGITLALVGLLLVTPVPIWVLRRAGKIDGKLAGELTQRYLSWIVLVAALFGPILLGAGWTILGVILLSLFCYREFAHASGMNRDRWVETLVYVAILVLGFAIADHWYGMFMAVMPLGICGIAALALVADQPQGYIQRVAIGSLGYMLFGCALGHVGYMANDADYRPRVLLLLTAVELNDVFAFTSGKLFGRRRLAPRTSPNKTIGGSLGAVLLTTLLVVWLGRYVFAGTVLAGAGHLAALGILLSLAGQAGDLVLSSVKRDLGIKDLGTLIPGHGGLLDRFDSLVLAAPAYFHFVNYYLGWGLDQPARIWSGG